MANPVKAEMGSSISVTANDGTTLSVNRNSAIGILELAKAKYGFTVTYYRNATNGAFYPGAVSATGGSWNEVNPDRVWFGLFSSANYNSATKQFTWAGATDSGWTGIGGNGDSPSWTNNLNDIGGVAINNADDLRSPVVGDGGMWFVVARGSLINNQPTHYVAFFVKEKLGSCNVFVRPDGFVFNQSGVNHVYSNPPQVRLDGSSSKVMIAPAAAGNTIAVNGNVWVGGTGDSSTTKFTFSDGSLAPRQLNGAHTLVVARPGSAYKSWTGTVTFKQGKTIKQIVTLSNV
jgi:hypothetical protein